MAILTVEDLTGACEAVVFSDAFERLAELLQPESMVFLTGTLDRRRDRPNIIVDEVTPIDRAIETLAGSVLLRLPPGATGELLQRLHDVLVRHRGSVGVLIELRPTAHGDVRATVRVGQEWSVEPTRGLVDELTGLLGEENLVLRPKRNASNGSGWNARHFSPVTAP
jgi:DNA polymerase-3 subunit alpha